MTICKANLAGSYSEALSAWHAHEKNAGDIPWRIMFRTTWRSVIRKRGTHHSKSPVLG